MRVQVIFSHHDEKLIRAGYKSKHGKDLNESLDALHYSTLPEYIKLGKRVHRREAISDFFETWGVVLFWVVIIGGGFTWNAISNSTKQPETSSYSSSGSSKSGISYDDVCPITTCNDGACSSSTGRGTCSHHGGVRY